MTLYDRRKNKLINELKNKKYRKAYTEESVGVGIPFQIRTIRNNKELSQEELGKLADIPQEAICRLENPNYGSFTIKTLLNIAAAFDMGLIVRFASFGELVKWDLNLSADSLAVPSYKEDPYFQNDEATTQNKAKITSCIVVGNIHYVNKWVDKESINQTTKLINTDKAGSEGIYTTGTENAALCFINKE